MAAGDGPCEVFSEGVCVAVAHDRYYYPDILVHCTPLADLDLIAREPCVVVEVTSPDTVRTDRNEKLTAYRGIDALKAYIIVDHRRRRVERHWRHSRDEEWQREEIVSAGSVRLPCADAELTLDEIYRRVELPAVGEPESAYESAKQQANTPQSSV